MSIAAAETPEGRGQKAHAALGRVLRNSKLRNGKAGRRLSNRAKADRAVRSAKVAVVRNAKSVRSALSSAQYAMAFHRRGGPRATPFCVVAG